MSAAVFGSSSALSLASDEGRDWRRDDIACGRVQRISRGTYLFGNDENAGPR
jgi:hypothetical protein